MQTQAQIDHATPGDADGWSAAVRSQPGAGFAVLAAATGEG